MTGIVCNLDTSDDNLRIYSLTIWSIEMSLVLINVFSLQIKKECPGQNDTNDLPVVGIFWDNDVAIINGFIRDPKAVEKLSTVLP